MNKFLCILLFFSMNSLFAQIPSSWYVVKNAQFCVAFPGEPNYSMENSTQAGTAVTITKWDFTEEQPARGWARCFSLYYHDYPSRYFDNFPKSEYLRLLAESVQGDSIFSNTKKVNMQNVPNPGIEVSGYNFKKFNFSFIVRFFLVDNRLYRLYASETDSLSYDAKLFLTSFEVY